MGLSVPFLIMPRAPIIGITIVSMYYIFLVSIVINELIQLNNNCPWIPILVGTLGMFLEGLEKGLGNSDIQTRGQLKSTRILRSSHSDLS